MDIKIIFIDFDWTIFDHRTYSIKESTIEAIKQARNKGIKLIINTGRSYYSLLSKQIVRDLKVDGYVVNNGGACIINDSVLYAHYLNKELKDNIINFLIENKISYGINCLKYSYGKTFEQGNVNAFYSVFDEPRTLDISEYKNSDDVLSITYFEKSEFDKIFKSKFKDVRINRFFDTCVEVTSVPFLKKEGVKEVLKYFNIDREFSLAIGDDINDIDMFNETKFSICVGNGKEELKKHATFISKDIKDNGIFDILKELKII